MKKLMMMLGILLPMPLFAADTPATLDTLRDQIASLTTTVNAMKQKIDDLRLGGVVGDIGAVKDTVSNQGVQIFMVTGGYTFVSQASKSPYTTTFRYSAPTYSDHGGNIPGVVVHASNGVTLPAGTYLFRQLPVGDTYGRNGRHTSSLTRENPYIAHMMGSSAHYLMDCWWRWTGEAGHATERVDGDVVWPMIRPAVFTFESTTTVKIHRPDSVYKDKYQAPPTEFAYPNLRFGGMIERL